MNARVSFLLSLHIELEPQWPRTCRQCRYICSIGSRDELFLHTPRNEDNTEVCIVWVREGMEQAQSDFFHQADFEQNLPDPDQPLGYAYAEYGLEMLTGFKEAMGMAHAARTLSAEDALAEVLLEWHGDDA